MQARLVALLAAVGLALLALLTALFAAPWAAASATGPGVRGTILDPGGAPVPGAVITVSRSDAEIGTATTDADGSWQVVVNEPGQYDVELDLDTLPAGLEPRTGGGERLTAVTVRPGAPRTVLFPLAAAGSDNVEPPPVETSGPATSSPEPPSDSGQTPSGDGLNDTLGDVAQLTVVGVKFGAIIAMTAVGLSLIFGTTGLINFAHGELVTLGAVVAWYLNVGGPTLPLVIAALLAIAVGALAGAGHELLLWRPLRRRGIGLIQLFIVSIGLSLLLRHLILWVFGSRPQPYGDYALQQVMTFGPVRITPRDLVVVILSLLVLVAVGLMLQRTRIGKAMRAVSDNRDLARSCGIDVDRVILIVWMLGGGLATIGGVFLGVTENISWDMGFNLLLLMFAGVILGGLGTAYGAVVGSFVVGLVAQLSTLWFPSELQNAWALGALIIVLIVRPQGILGQRERIG